MRVVPRLSERTNDARGKRHESLQSMGGFCERLMTPVWMTFDSSNVNQTTEAGLLHHILKAGSRSPPGIDAVGQ